MTDKTRIKSRPATEADVLAFYKSLPGQTIRARVLEKSGKIVGIAGYYLAGGHSIVFSEVCDEMTKMEIWREAVALMETIPSPSICAASPASTRFLKRLGWEFLGPSEYGDLYQWRN